jgi:hypothetical protein
MSINGTKQEEEEEEFPMGGIRLRNFTKPS